jgi:hypothetical protein
MQSENNKNLPEIGEMKKRRVLMADERRYLIYYTFDKDSPASSDDTSKFQNAEGEARDEKGSALDSSFIISDSSLISGGRENV